jgi:uncharacterized membrane protein
MMVKHGIDLWRKHPAVRTDKQLSFGERAADVLKHWFGTWVALGSVAAGILIWVLLQSVVDKNHGLDPYPWLLLNIGLSMIAAVQGIILQISANRGDRISGEVAVHTESNTDELMVINKNQLVLLEEIRGLRAEVKHVAEQQDRDEDTK